MPPRASMSTRRDHGHRESHVSCLWRLSRSPRPAPDVPFSPPSPGRLNVAAFTGRLGGHQQYALDMPAPVRDMPTRTHRPETPDAYRDASWPSILSLHSLRNPLLWRMAVLKGVGTCVQTTMGAYLGIGLVATAHSTSVGAVFPVSLAALGQVWLISLFVWGMGPLTGGHLNPLITVGALCVRLCSLPRAVLYVSAQCIGAVAAGWLVRGALGTGAKSVAVVPGCNVDPALVTPGEAFALEVTAAFFTLFLACALGLDPRVEASCGTALAPLLIGVTSALTIYCTGFVKVGYLGASTNLARCLGLMTAAGRFDYHYAHWAGDMAAALLNGLLYAVLPPYDLNED